MSVEMSQERVAQVEMLIRFFNMQAGTSYKCSTENNQNAVNTAIEKSNGNIVELKNYVRSYVNEQKGNILVECFESYEGSKKEEPKVITETPKQEVVPERPEFAMAILEKVILQTIAQTQVGKIQEEIMSGVEQKVKDFIKAEYGTLERKVVTVVDGKKLEVGEGEIIHEKFDTICKFVANNEPVFLTGQAGNG